MSDFERLPVKVRVSTPTEDTISQVPGLEYVAIYQDGSTQFGTGAAHVIREQVRRWQRENVQVIYSEGGDEEVAA